MNRLLSLYNGSRFLSHVLILLKMRRIRLAKLKSETMAEKGSGIVKGVET